MKMLVCVTPHGFGHAAQVVAVLEALGAAHPEVELHIATRVPEAWLRERLSLPFRYHARATDFGLVMHSPVEIDHAASAAAYAALYDRREALLDEERRFLEGIGPDRVLADVPWLPLAAARDLGMPAVGLCSLNWAGIYRHFYGGRPEGAAVFEWLRAAYAAADVFLRPAPAMPMPELPNVRDIGPLARRGRDRSAGLRDRFDLAADERLVLVALGGVAGRLPVEDWPRRPGVRWLVEDAWGVEREDVIAVGATGLSFLDLLASADAVLGKCGYGTVAECAVNGTPLLAIRREDGWPEDAPLAEWLARHGRMRWITRAQAEAGDFIADLEALLAEPAPEPPAPTGATDAAQLLLEPGGDRW